MRIAIFDSGVGGLTVARALRAEAPDADLCYCADTGGFPYGAWDEPELVERICEVVGALIEKTKPDVVVIACNTASTIALATLRHRFDVPFVGTVPAIKLAANMTKSGRFSVLATPRTVSCAYTKALIDTFAYHCKVTLHGAHDLAQMAELKLAGGDVDLVALKTEIAPAFVDDEGVRTDVVALGCTHYPFLEEEIRKVAPWPVTLIDPAPAVAKQAVRLAGEGEVSPQRWAFANCAFVTGKPDQLKITSDVLASFGFGRVQILGQRF